MKRIISVLLLIGLMIGSISITSAASLDDCVVTISNTNYDEENGLISFRYDWKWNQVQKLKSTDEIQFEWKSQTVNLKPVNVSASVDYGDIKTGEFLETKMGEVTTHRWKEALEVSFENVIESDDAKMAVIGGSVEITLGVAEGVMKDAEVHINTVYVKEKMFHGDGLSTRTSEESKVATGVVLSRIGTSEPYEIRIDGREKTPTLSAILLIAIVFVVLAILIAKNAGIKMVMIPLVMIFAVIPLILIGWDWMINTFYIPDIVEFEEHELYLDPAVVTDEKYFMKPEDIQEIKIVHSGDCDIEVGYLCMISEETHGELFRRIVNDFFGEEKQYQITEDMTDIYTKSYKFYLTVYDHSGKENMTLFYHNPGVIQWNGQFFVTEKLISDAAVEEAVRETIEVVL